MARARQRKVALIPARGGSKGIPGKNLKLVDGVPLLVRSIAAARESGRIDEIFVSSDDRQILDTASRHGATPVVRPAELAMDSSSSESALLHALPALGDPAIIVFLQCTSPFTTPADIAHLVDALDQPRFNSALCVIEDHGFLWTADASGEGRGINHDPLRARVRRQDLPPQFRESGQGYAFRTAAFLQTKNRFCPPMALVVTRHPPIEVDDARDLLVAEAFAKSSRT